ncbi:hypothetical protein PQG44_04490 [Aquirufa sp. LEPPI-3A]|uniref:hypothetical protein n=1 Tax=Aquirufa regiilacus TaxID=3024868 RepID=UPI0028DF4DD6|nr:hypothetical protein [Aquirufa sp. LEPPI-3A]MDT8886920.1 hypothetical protein [Aquirufa sp. LEPPI-3A]
MEKTNFDKDFKSLTPQELILLNGGDNVTQWLFYKAGQIYQSFVKEIQNSHPAEYYK